MIEINNLTRFKINDKKVKTVIESFIRTYKIKNEDISVALVGERRIQKLNSQYRGKDAVTDILSFAGDDEFLGELVICPQQIIRQSRIHQSVNAVKAAENEFIFILVHGLLHLIGMNDDSEKKRLAMIEEGGRFLKSIKLFK